MSPIKGGLFGKVCRRKGRQRIQNECDRLKRRRLATYQLQCELIARHSRAFSRPFGHHLFAPLQESHYEASWKEAVVLERRRMGYASASGHRLARQPG